MIVLIWLTACAPKVDTAPADPGPRDRDGDGYPAATDCDDLDPGATDRQVAYADGDGDGYGGAATEPLCTLPSGFVWTGGDCDDGSAGVYPGASEVCNGVDDDCDGRVDDADDSLDTSTGTWWSPDGDGDGYGDGTSGVWACGRPEGYVGNAEDCDDGAAEVRPGAEEVCNGVDDDCNGAADDLRLCDVVSVSEVAAATYVGNHREDVLGWTVAVLPDLTGDGKPDVAMGSLGWDNDSGEHLPGYLWVFDGQRRGEIEAADADVVYRAIWFGGSNTDITTPAATDLDGDGLADLVFHSDAHDWDDYAGGVYVNYGPLGSGHGISESDGRLLPPADLAFTSFFGSGFAVSNGAVLIGQYLAESGTVWLVHEPWWGDTVVTDLDAVRLSGEGYSSHAGWLVELADVTGDGVDDAMVSAPWLDWGGSGGVGGVYVVHGPIVGDQSLADADAVHYGLAAEYQLGELLSVVGDVDGDGTSEFWAARFAGLQSWALSGGTTGAWRVTNSAVVSFVHDEAGNPSAAEHGDIDGDGWNDVVFGQMDALTVLRTPMLGTITVWDDAWSMVAPVSVDENSGVDFVAVGDIDLDGWSDVLFADPTNPDVADSRAWLVLGSSL